LLESIPRKGVAHKAELPTIEGIVPSLLTPPTGCRFADRCRRFNALGADDQRRCRQDDPALRPDRSGWVACHFPLDGGVR
jgi:peptide/nickel transport system ATP-binding protein